MHSILICFSFALICTALDIATSSALYFPWLLCLVGGGAVRGRGAARRNYTEERPAPGGGYRGDVRRGVAGLYFKSPPKEEAPRSQIECHGIHVK